MEGSPQPEDLEYISCLRSIFDLMVAEGHVSDSELLSAISTLEHESANAPSVLRLREHLERYRSLVSTLSILPRETQRGVDRLVTAWTAVVVRRASATFALIDCGFTDAAYASTRVALEHAVFLSFLATRSDLDTGLDRLADSFGFATRGLFVEDLEGSELFAKLFAELPVDDRGRPWSSNVQAMCSRLKSGPIVYRAYRLLSQQMHADYSSALPYLWRAAQDPEGPLPTDPVSAGTPWVAFMAVASCTWATWSFDAITGSSHFSADADAIGEELDLTHLSALGLE